MARSLSSLGLGEASGARAPRFEVVRERGEETVNLIKDAGGEAICVTADVSQSSDVQTMVRAAVSTYGGLDCAINNAVLGIGRSPLADINEDDWDRSIGVNLTGVFLCMKYEI